MVRISTWLNLVKASHIFSYCKERRKSPRYTSMTSFNLNCFPGALSSDIVKDSL